MQERRDEDVLKHITTWLDNVAIGVLRAGGGGIQHAQNELRFVEVVARNQKETVKRVAEAKMQFRGVAQSRSPSNPPLRQESLG